MSVAGEKYLARAREALRTATLDDFLGFLTVRRFAGGSATARFYDAFPVVMSADGTTRGGRSELLEMLKRESAPTEIETDAPVTTTTLLRLLKLISDLKDRNPTALDEMKAIALDDFDGYYGSPEEHPHDVMSNLMAAAARQDPEARERLAVYYRALTQAYVGTYEALLLAFDREPIDSIGSVDNLAIVITALYDGLAVRARVGEPARELLSNVLLPIVAALTVPVGKPSLSDAELLFE
jgi:hypothetical protein